ncbi:hypothetical protein SAMN03159353_103130 [Cedecea sp. NFIX57]|nr:hypothetical protein SAMN03159353_103130 [Cedecea sp. NFIX57]
MKWFGSLSPLPCGERVRVRGNHAPLMRIFFISPLYLLNDGGRERLAPGLEHRPYESSFSKAVLSSSAILDIPSSRVSS